MTSLSHGLRSGVLAKSWRSIIQVKNYKPVAVLGYVQLTLGQL